VTILQRSLPRLAGPRLTVVVPLTVFAALTAAVALDAAVPLDARLVEFVYAFSARHATLQRAEWASGILGDVRSLAVVLALVIVALLAARRLRHAAWVVSAAAIMVMEPVLAEALRRPMPYPGPGYAFPGGHALGTMTIAATIVLLIPRGAPRAAFGAFAFVGVFVAGVSAVGDGGHWPTDVIAGWALALGWVALTWRLIGRGPADLDAAPQRRNLPAALRVHAWWASTERSHPPGRA